MTLLMDRRELADHIAARAGWQVIEGRAGQFQLVGYRRYSDPATKTLTVYVEGDGYAWISSRQLSPDPTPREPQGLELAVLDPSPNVLYLARPCQYQSAEALRRCHPRYWSEARYAEEVIAAMDAMIDDANRELDARRLRLVGYSGGGAVVALLAARRPDVVQLVTVAANLDLARWTRLKEVTPLNGSLNPADQARRLQSVPQIHFVGEDDDVVPPAVAQSYVARMTDRSRTRIVEVPGADHACCWTRRWPGLLATYVYAGG